MTSLHFCMTVGSASRNEVISDCKAVFGGSVLGERRFPPKPLLCHMIKHLCRAFPRFDKLATHYLVSTIRHYPDWAT